MKTYIKVLLILIITTVISCETERIDTPPVGNTEATFFNDVVEFRQTLVIVYAKLTDFYFFNPDFNWANCVTPIWMLPGDDLTETQGARTAEELFDGGLNPTNFRLTFFWDRLYELIARANVIIDKVNTVDYSNYAGADEITQMEGEALFLRGYAYFNIFNVYGNAPLVVERILSEDKTNTPKSDKMEILDQVISDARTAIDILPESWSPEFAGRATKNSARALLAKALVFRANFGGNNADYAEAVTVFNTIDAILLESFTDNFNAFTENNAESLFEVQASKPTAGDNIILGNDGPWRGVENMTIYRGFQQMNGTTAANWAPTKFIITQKLLNQFGTDPRIDTFLIDEDGFEGLLFQKYTIPALDNLVPFHDNSTNNERVFRYAGLKLIAAEGLLKSGNPADAIAHINDIRDRARNWALETGIGDGTVPADRDVNETDATTIMQWIMDERYVELAGEGHRWWDLKRWHAAGDINLTGWDGSEQFFSTNLASPVQFDVSKHLLFPIPQQEIERNDAILENNPGY